MRVERVFTVEEIAGGARRARSRDAGADPGADTGGGARCCGRHRTGDPAHGDGCALVAVFAAHLTALRRASGGPPPGPLRCCDRPAADPALRTTLPHLVAVRLADGTVVDRIVWEVVDRAAFRAWLPGAGPPERWISRLDELRGVRELLRAADPPAVLGPLRDRLGGGHFSMRFVVEHPDLVAAALAALAAPAEPATPAAPGGRHRAGAA